MAGIGVLFKASREERHETLEDGNPNYLVGQ